MFPPIVQSLIFCLPLALKGNYIRVRPRRVTKDLKGQDPIQNEHVDNSTAVRNMLLERGIKPEILPPVEDVKKVQRKLEVEDKKALMQITREKGE